MDLSGWAAAIQESRKAGLLHRGLKVLNLVNTARGAATTVVLAASAIGGATAIQQATDRAANPDRAEHSEAPRQQGAGGRFAPSPSRPPVTAASIRADAEARLQAALQQAAAAVDDLKKVSVLPPARLDQLVSDTKAKLRQRADLAMTQIAELAAPTTASSPRLGGPSAPAASFSILTLDALVRLAAADLNGIVTQATRVATTPPTPPPPPPTPPPTAVPATLAPTARPTLPPVTHSPSSSPRR